MKVLEIQELLDDSPSNPLHQALSVAKADLHNCLQVKEMHWRQKSRIRWLNEGDRNSGFFHASTKSRGAVNRIDKILYDGNWVEDQSQIHSLAINHFSFVANSIHRDPSDYLFGIDSIKVTVDQNSHISIIPEAKEIRGAVFDLKRECSPSPMVSQATFSLQPSTSLAPL